MTISPLQAEEPSAVYQDSHKSYDGPKGYRSNKHSDEYPDALEDLARSQIRLSRKKAAQGVVHDLKGSE